ncbi:MAG: 1-(5-phosphoribosyl)-5-[(5-phosphoribosylamino)methylideneamino]imidazole-4-carboxamide isomerase [Armatimonadetes bacterium]|jgi:phosphoribosylformimino-5-aminoimidazole carboxamide ribotide isomerase|nr:1-(5-phosphoribosyl)-5-[(5-phosphoribosylamino)methylideneamino]imidazole-4-carboxamide isomerase [Armatimonadota bacterium]
MEIIPAIDIRGGRCVRLLQGDYARETVYGEDPVAMAERWEAEGATRLHVVDLDGAREGQPTILPLLEHLCAAVHVPVQVGGGIRSLESARQALAAGAARVILGTSAALNPALAEEVFATLGEQAILGLDAREGIVAIHGWRETTGEAALAFAHRMKAAGARRIIYTDISRDGMLQGVNAAACAHLAAETGLPVIASGGVSTLADIHTLKELPGIEAAIIGKALYTGALSLTEALAASAGS